MDKRLDRLIEILCAERDQKVPNLPDAQKPKFFRALVNLRMPSEASEEFLELQDEYLRDQIRLKGITDIDELSPFAPDVYLWKGDITTLRCDAIVNAANSQMLGCFCPNHGCIDNAIHTFAGIQLRYECAGLMNAQDCEDLTGQAKITKAYNLPCKYIFHTVGPTVCGKLTERHEEQLASCYRSCLTLADKYGVQSMAFCCISTGEFHFPNERAAEIALRTAEEYKRSSKSKIKIIFNVFKDYDYDIYTKLIGANR